MKPLAMSGTCNARTPGGVEVSTDIRLIDNRKPLARDFGDVRYFDILFTLPQIRSRFSDLMVAWFSRSDGLQSLYDLYFGAMLSPATYIEHRFLNFFQALESYNRRTSVSTPDKAEARAERLDRISKAMAVEDWKWLKKKLRPPGPSAADRINHVVDHLNARWLLTREQVTLAGDLRNYYTHFDPALEARLPPTKGRFRIMHNLTVRLRVLCELVLLDAIGLAGDTVQKQIEGTRRVKRHLMPETE